MYSLFWVATCAGRWGAQTPEHASWSLDGLFVRDWVWPSLCGEGGFLVGVWCLGWYWIESVYPSVASLHCHLRFPKMRGGWKGGKNEGIVVRGSCGLHLYMVRALVTVTCRRITESHLLMHVGSLNWVTEAYYNIIILRIIPGATPCTS